MHLYAIPNVIVRIWALMLKLRILNWIIGKFLKDSCILWDLSFISDLSLLGCKQCKMFCLDFVVFVKLIHFNCSFFRKSNDKHTATVFNTIIQMQKRRNSFRKHVNCPIFKFSSKIKHVIQNTRDHINHKFSMLAVYFWFTLSYFYKSYAHTE